MKGLLDFSGQHVVVTGGTRGIGAEISKIFAEYGAIVHAIYRGNDQRAEQLIDQLSGEGHTLHICDVSDPAAVLELFESLKITLSRIDILINNAGLGYHHPIDTASYEDWQEGWKTIIGTNLLGPANVSYQAAQMMIPQRSGKIINVSSRGAFRGEPHQPAYGASKAGLNSLTQSLAYQLSQYNIYVGAVAPGFVNTEMAYDRLQGEPGRAIKSQSPMNRVAEPREVAEAVLLMAGANQWMTGTIIDVNGASYFRT